jgi:hypothetical protein
MVRSAIILNVGKETLDFWLKRNETYETPKDAAALLDDLLRRNGEKGLLSLWEFGLINGQRSELKLSPLKAEMYFAQHSHRGRRMPSAMK